MVLPNREGGKAFRELSARYRAMEGLIDAALEKRRTGSYPAALKNLPTDPFTGKPMKYRFGKVPMRRFDRDEEGYIENVRFESQPGVAVWSVGSNGVDDDGANGHAYSDDRRDDLRALIALPTAP